MTRLDGWVVAWTPTHHRRDRPGVSVGQRVGGSARPVIHPDGDGAPRFSQWLDLPRGRSLKATRDVLRLFATVVIRDGINANDAHREFLKVPAYQAALGTEDGGGPPL